LTIALVVNYIICCFADFFANWKDFFPMDLLLKLGKFYMDTKWSGFVHILFMLDLVEMFFFTFQEGQGGVIVGFLRISIPLCW